MIRGTTPRTLTGKQPPAAQSPSTDDPRHHAAHPDREV